MTETDRELLGLAFKAGFHGADLSADKDMQRRWNPLKDDGDALRLAVKLKLDICRPSKVATQVYVWLDHLGGFIEEPLGGDPYAATRRAIVRAAAEIGRAA